MNNDANFFVLFGGIALFSLVVLLLDEWGRRQQRRRKSQGHAG